MALTTNTRSQAAGIANHACGNVVTDAAAAAATTITVGFIPRIFRWINITSTAAMKKSECYEGMASGNSIDTIPVATTPAASQQTLNTSGPVINSDGTVTIPAALIPVSSTFVWEAVG